jgi:hypothetical protein
MKFSGFFGALCVTFFVPALGQAEIYTNNVLDNPSRNSEFYPQHGSQLEALAQKAALEVARVSIIAKANVEASAHVVSSQYGAVANTFSVAVESQVEMMDLKDKSSFTRIYRRHYSVSFSKTSDGAPEVSVRHVKTDVKDTKH